MLTMLTSNADFVWDSLRNFAGSTGIAGFFSEMGWGSVAMICVAFFLLYLAIRHKFEPLLLFTIAFGMLLTNLPGANLYHTELFADGHVHWDIFVANAGLLDYLYLGVKLGIYPCLIFVGVGAMTTAEALSWGWTGPCLRATGLAYDVRRSRRCRTAS